MLGSRRGRPSLIGRAAQTAARTAVITATATTVAGKAAARQAPGAPTPAAAEPPAPAPGGFDDEAIARLQKLAELHNAGILTAEEFAIQKARILA
jgi:Short C-terminal domain